MARRATEGALRRAKRSGVGKPLHFLFGASIAGGLVLLGWASWALLVPAPAPYRYELISEGPVGNFPDLGLDGPETLSIRKFEVRATGAAAPVAVLHLADPGKGSAPVLLEWRNRTAEPLLTAGAPLADLNTLAQAVARHVPTRAVVLGWWDTARQLKLLAGVDILFDDNLAQPLLIPPAWSSRQDSIEALEHRFWKVSRDSEPLFARYLEALLSEPAAGAARLRQLVGERRAFVAVHLNDAYKLGALRPERFGIGYRDFAGSGEIHGQVKRVKDWLDEHGYRSYAVEKKGVNVNRVYFLADARTEETLLARMLPFSSSNPLQLEELQLVANYAGYWVYEVPGAVTAR